ncbi:MAG: hypothetical protein R6X34_22630, partial [Chloroflexota bacterium]
MNNQPHYRIRIYLIWGTLALCAVMYVALPVIASQWARQPFPGFMRDPNLVVSDTGNNSGWPAKLMAPPIVYPDRVTAVNGHPLSSAAQFDAYLRTFQIGEEIDLTLTQPQNSAIPSAQTEPERTQSVPLISFSATDMWNFFWLYYFCGLVFLLIGIITFYLRANTTPAQVMALLAIVGAASTGAIFDLNTTQIFTRVWLTGMAFIGSANLLLAVHFPYKNTQFAKRPWLNWFIFLPSFVALLWAQWWLYSPSDPWAYALTWRVLFFLNGVGIVISLILLTYRSVSSPSPLVRQQARVILMGAVLAFQGMMVVGKTRRCQRHGWLLVTFLVGFTPGCGARRCLALSRQGPRFPVGTAVLQVANAHLRRTQALLPLQRLGSPAVARVAKQTEQPGHGSLQIVHARRTSDRMPATLGAAVCSQIQELSVVQSAS